METIQVEGLAIFYEAGEQETAQLLQPACEKSIRLLQKNWGLDTPPDCRVYVMTSWGEFFIHAAPWMWKVLLVLLWPFWVFNARRIWPHAGGWSQQFGKRRAVGVKPSRLLQTSDSSIGERIFIKIEELDTKVQLVVCHELTHAFTAHLRLPMWLNEGLAQVTAEKFWGRPMIQAETIQALSGAARDTDPGRYRKARVSDPDALIYHYVRGYWLTRYLEDARPGLVKSLLTQRYAHQELEAKVAAACEMDEKEFWQEIDGLVVAHYAQPGK